MPKRTDISSIPVIAGALALACHASLSAARSDELTRIDHDHTVYLLSGPPEKLAQFEAEIGSSWQGGILIGKNTDADVFTYWAFGGRTASQSREFIMPATFSGLELSFEPYEEVKLFPEYRGKLDQIALDCGLIMDPFFLSPVATIRLLWTSESDFEKNACVIEGVRKDKALAKLPIGFVGNEKMPKEEGN